MWLVLAEPQTLQPAGSSTLAYHFARRFCRGISVILGTSWPPGGWSRSISSKTRDCGFYIVGASLPTCITSQTTEMRRTAGE